MAYYFKTKITFPFYRRPGSLCTARPDSEGDWTDLDGGRIPKWARNRDELYDRDGDRMTVVCYVVAGEPVFGPVGATAPSL